MFPHYPSVKCEDGGGIVRHTMVWPCCVVEVGHFPGLSRQLEINSKRSWCIKVTSFCTFYEYYSGLLMDFLGR